MTVKNLEILIKPASSRCNLRCSYCFYRDEAEHREAPDRGLLSPDTAEHLLRSVFDFAAEEVTFTFQGGEPLLAGLPFFEDFVARAKQLCGSRKLHWSLQTNGTLLTEAFAGFLKRESFLVGVSLDGPEELHDACRGAGSFRKTMAGLELLRRYEIPFNILCVVTDRSARNPERLYRFFRDNGFSYLQFLPCLSRMGEEECLLSAEVYGSFLCSLFSLWLADLQAGRAISIRYFENLALILSGRPPRDCTLCGSCRLQLTVEANGDVYPCDYYCLDGYRLGNICGESLAAMVQSDPARDFLRPRAIPEECRTCSFYQLCRGGCRREGTPKTCLCPAYRTLFTHMRSQSPRTG